MKIFDLHLHAFGEKENPNELLNRLNQTGIYGACVFSNRSDRYNKKTGTSFNERLKETLTYAKAYPDRFFPVMWIHPYEENIISNIHKAVESGVVAFKIICGDFYIYEDRCLEVLQEIANLNKPVIFHTGILWEGEPNSEFSRPVHFEAMLKVKNLRFSMGHCSWPWIDECLAVYGKFQSAKTFGCTSEMFLDLTPGTPEIYRKELFYKIFNIGYDVKDNVMFGTDCVADDYNVDYAKSIISTDTKILTELGVDKETQQKLFSTNIMRFLGLNK
jgi:predicted TIM-barrel fold metal-dependent hydrolase